MMQACRARVWPLVREPHRFVGTMCRVCAYRTSRQLLGAEHTRRTRSLATDFACMSVVPYTRDQDNANLTPDAKIISVTNLEQLLELLPLTEKDLQAALAQTCSLLPRSLPDSDYIHVSACGRNPALACLDGQHLDHLFGIKTESPENAGPSQASSETDNRVVDLFQRWTDLMSHISEQFLLKSDTFNNSQLISENPHDNCLPGNIQVDSVTTSQISGAMSCNHGNRHMRFCSDVTDSNVKKTESDDRKPSLQELELIHTHLTTYLPKMFSTRHDYRIYTKDLVFENNFAQKPFTSVGLDRYVKEVAKYRIYAHIQYANIRMHLLKATIHEDDGCVKIRWRVSGIPQVRAFMFWKFLPWKYKKSVDSESEWIDGFSTFYVQPKTGLIWKHRLDKVIMDESTDAKVAVNILDKLVPGGTV